MHLKVTFWNKNSGQLWRTQIVEYIGNNGQKISAVSSIWNMGDNDICFSTYNTAAR